MCVIAPNLIQRVRGNVFSVRNWKRTERKRVRGQESDSSVREREVEIVSANECDGFRIRQTRDYFTAFTILGRTRECNEKY